MNSDPRFRPHSETQPGLLTAALGMDLLVLAGQIAMELAQKAATLDGDPRPATRDTKLEAVNSKPTPDDIGLNSSKDDLPISSEQTAGIHTGEVVAPFSPVTAIANHPVTMEIGGHSASGWSAPTMLSSIMNVLAALPANTTLGSGPPASLGHYQGTRFALSGGADVRHTEYEISGCRRDLCGNWLSGVSPAG